MTLPTLRSRSIMNRLRSINSLMLVSVVLLAFLALWSWDLGYPALSSDEAFVAILAGQPAGEILRRLNTDEPHPPVFYMAMHAWNRLVGGRPELIVRFPLVMTGIVLLSLTYRIARELGAGPLAALLPAIWLGVSPQVVVHVREARMYGPMITSVAAVVLIALKFGRLPRRGSSWLAAAVTALALLTHYFNVLFVGVISIWALFTLDRAARRRWLGSQAIAWSVLAVWLVWMGHGFFNPTSLSQGKTWSWVLPPWETLARVITVGVFGYRDIPEAGLILIGGALLIGGWWLGSFAQPTNRRWLLGLGLAGPLVLYAGLCWLKPLYHPKYMLPWLLFASLAIGGLMIRRRRLGSGVYCALIVIMIGPMFRTLRLPYDSGLAPGRNDWLQPRSRQLSQQLVTWFGPTDVFGLGTPDATPCYYTNDYFDRPLGCELIPSAPGVSVDQTQAQLDSLFTQHAGLWYLDYYNPAWDPRHVAEAAFAASSLSLGTEQIAGSRLRLYTSAAAIQRQMRSVGVRFGEAAELAGIWYRRGNDLHLVLIWRALTDHPAIEAKVFVHWLDESGQMIAQDDSVPVAWTRPLSSWQRGEQLLDVHILTAPREAGLITGSLRIGLYNAATNTRLRAYDQNGVRLADDAVLVPLAERP